jgi:hypothetical protein
MDQLVLTAGQFRRPDCRRRSPAGGTGSYDDGAIQGITEIQAGSYALMDTDYAKLGLPFVMRCPCQYHHQPSGSGTMRRRQRPQVVHEGPRQPFCPWNSGRIGTHAQRRARDDCHPPRVRHTDWRPHPVTAVAHRSDDESARRGTRSTETRLLGVADFGSGTREPAH